MDVISTASFILSAFSLLISALSVFYGMTLKSYEILINKRMQTYQEIKDCFRKLSKLTKKYEISKYCEQNRSGDYCQQLRKEYNQLESLLSQTEPQEFYLMHQVKKLIDTAVGICESVQQCGGLDELEQEAEITFLYSDIYCWTLWLYVQGLHKFWWRLVSYHRMFDKNFKKVYERAKRLHSKDVYENAERLHEEPDFFKRYPLEKILGLPIRKEENNNITVLKCKNCGAMVKNRKRKNLQPSARIAERR